MFSSLTQPDVVDGSSNHLSSATVIHNLLDNDATTEDGQPQVNNIEKKENRRRKKTRGHNLEDLSPSERAGQEVDHQPPTTKGETTYQRGGRWICSSRTTTGGLRHSGRANRASDLPISSDCKSDSLIGQNQAWGGADEADLSAQLSSAVFLPIHQDKPNYGTTWLIALGTFTGGRLWLESSVGSFPPPCAKEQWQANLRGDHHDVSNKWLNFDGPFFSSDDGYSYFLVDALRLPGFPLLIDVLLLTSRASIEVCDQLGERLHTLNPFNSKVSPLVKHLASRDCTVIEQENSLLHTLSVSSRSEVSV